MAKPDDTPSMAVFCDFENVALGVRDAKYEKFDIRKVLERLLLKGSIVVKKAYCDWERYREFKAPMHEASFELIEIPHVRQSGKNSADIRMVVDALDLCYTKGHVDTFVIISGDSDFSPLVSKLRENAKTVIGVGVKGSTSDLLTANCDEFIFYDDLVREQRRQRANREASARSPRPPARGGATTDTGNGRGTTPQAVLPPAPRPAPSPATAPASAAAFAPSQVATALPADDTLAPAAAATPARARAPASSRRRPAASARPATNTAPPTPAPERVSDALPTVVPAAEASDTLAAAAAAGPETAIADAPAEAAPKKRAPRRRKTAQVAEATDGTEATDVAGASGLAAASPEPAAAEASVAPSTDAGRDAAEPSNGRSDEDRRQEAVDLAVGTVEALLAERGADDKIWGSMVKQTLKRRRPGFAESYYGYRSFNELLEDARDRGLLALEHDEKSGGYVIRLL